MNNEETEIKIEPKPTLRMSAFQVNARRIKQHIPPSWFTKKGPGVDAKAQLFFQRLDAYDRGITLRMGWFPAAWAKLPFKPWPNPEARRAHELWEEKARAEIAKLRADISEVETKGIVRVAVGKVWGGIKSLFRRKTP